MSDDFGIKVTQPGYDTETAPDAKLLFSSSWPLLKTEKDNSYTITADIDQVIYTHNLGYPAAFFINDGTGGFATSNPILNQNIGVNSIELKFAGGSGLTLPLTIHFYIFRLPLNKNFKSLATNISTELSDPTVQDWGIKIAKEGKDISSSDYRDFAVHSGTQSPMIHEVTNDIVQDINGGGQGIWAVVSNHNLGYYPLFFPFVLSTTVLSGYYRFTGNYTQTPPRVFGTTLYTRIELTLTSQPKPAGACLIVFKDPQAVLLPSIEINA